MNRSMKALCNPMVMLIYDVCELSVTSFQHEPQIELFLKAYNITSASVDDPTVRVGRH